MEIEAALAISFVDFDDERMGLGKSVLTDGGDLPGNVDVGLVGFDGELMVRNTAAHDGLGELSDDGELVPEVGVDGFEPVRKLNGRVPLSVGGDVAV